MSKSDPEAEYEALRTGWGVLERSWISVLPVTGEDCQRFLQGLLTCDVKALEPGQGAYGFFTDAKGHILSDVVIRAFADRMWLELPETTAAAIVAHLEKYIVADRVEIHPPAQLVALTVAGQRSGEFLANVAGADLFAEAMRWSHRPLEILGEGVVLAAESRMGVEAFTLWVGAGEVAALRAALMELEKPTALPAVSLETAEILRVEAGVPVFGRDFGPENLPQETGLDEAVSYTKGCYLGQEVIARLHYRGQVTRQIRVVRFAGAEPPPVGAPLVYDNREAGKVTSVARSPSTGRVVGIAMLQTRAAVSGTLLACKDGGSAAVV